MAQRIITLCDVHARSDEDKAGATWEVTLTGPGLKATTWEVDLCADDGKGLEDLATMLDEVGRVTHGKRAKAPTAARNGARTAGQGRPGPVPIEAPTDASGAFPCPVDGCGKTSRTQGGLRTHLSSKHGMTLAEATGAPLPYACPHCERKFSHPTGMHAHVRSAHPDAE